MILHELLHPHIVSARKFILAICISSICVLPISTYAQIEHIAAEAYDYGNYFEAIDLYSKLVVSFPEENIYKINLGNSYLRTHVAPKKALGYFLEVYETGDFDLDFLLDLARAHMYHLQYDDALKVLKEFKTAGGLKKKNEGLYNRMVANCEAALDLMKYPVRVKFKNLGENINTEYPDYHPFFSENGENIVFTSRRKVRPGSKPEFDGYFPSDIFMAKKGIDGWELADRLGDRINTIYDEQSVGYSKSGDSLFFYIDHIDNFGDIYLSVRRRNIYTPPVELEVINTAAVESSCSVSRDGSALVFSSDRKGGSGLLDIWMVKKDEEGNWGEPENLGESINTSFNEDFPTLSSDGKTLYFCSEGHPGMGGYDLYFSTWDDQSKIWTTPQNLGYPLNGPGNEKNISFSASGKQAVMTAHRDDGYGDLDIYEVNYLDTDNEEPAVFLVNLQSEDGTVLAEIKVRDELDEPVGSYMPNKVTERTLLALQPGKYFLYVDAPGYKPHNEVLVVNNFHKRQDPNLKLIKLEK
jgi:hypothetical protein